MINLRLFLTLVVFLFAISSVSGDTDGVWHESEDIRGGVIASDEQDNTESFTFINPVNINSVFEVNGPTSLDTLNVSSDAYMGDIYATQLISNVDDRFKLIPHGNSNLAHVFASQAFYAPTFVDTNSWDPVRLRYDDLVNPSATSNMNIIQANIIYDRGNNAFFMDPASTSRFNRLETNSLFVAGQDIMDLVEPDINYALSNREGGTALSCGDGNGDGCTFVLEKRTSDPRNPEIGRMWIRTDLS